MLRSVALATATFLAASACATMPAATGSQGLRAMTYNIQYGHEGLDSVADVIRTQKPDIVGLQEVDVHWNERSGFVDQAELLAKATGMNYRFARIYQLPVSDPSKPPRECGVAILTRFPIVSFTNHVITRLSTQEANPVPQPLPGFLEATLDVNGTKVRDSNMTGMAGSSNVNSRCVNGRYLLYMNMNPIAGDNVNRVISANFGS